MFGRTADRGVSPVVSVVLVVGLTVCLGAVVAAAALGTTGSLVASPPQVSSAVGTLVGDGPASDDQTVRLTHVAGDDVPVADIEIRVRLPNGNEGVVRALPAAGTSFLGDPSVLAGDVVDATSGSGALTRGGTDTDGVWTAGESLQFRIKESDDGMELRPGDTVVVTVVHSASNTVLASETLTAT